MDAISLELAVVSCPPCKSTDLKFTGVEATFPCGCLQHFVTWCFLSSTITHQQDRLGQGSVQSSWGCEVYTGARNKRRLSSSTCQGIDVLGMRYT
eukprot:5052860-Amphidinium_carterae.2